MQGTVRLSPRSEYMELYMKNAVFPMLAALVVFSFMSFGCANPADEMVYNYFYTLSNQEEAESLYYI